MTMQVKDPECEFWCWATAAAIGGVVLFMLLGLAEFKLFPAIFLGLLSCLLLGFLFNWLFCAPVPVAYERGQTRAVGVPEPETAKSEATDAARMAEQEKSDAAARSDAAAKAEAEQAAADQAAKAKAEAEQAEQAAKDKALADQAAANIAAAKAEETALKEARIKADAAAAQPAPTVVAEAPQEPSIEAVEEVAEEVGSKPVMLAAARDGDADDLKRIKGIGPKLEQLCNEMGFYHFDQIAAWSTEEIAWVNANLAGFKGRVSRDNWVEQAKLLAAGGETEFSQRVDKGSVY